MVAVVSSATLVAAVSSTVVAVVSTATLVAAVSSTVVAVVSSAVVATVSSTVVAVVSSTVVAAVSGTVVVSGRVSPDCSVCVVIDDSTGSSSAITKTVCVRIIDMTRHALISFSRFFVCFISNLLWDFGLLPLDSSHRCNFS